ncbi:MAG: transporter substrate-binding protein [Rhodoglobus sp.]|nr:transporter substrate-binding protein [Rhodoglobus sp.]
MSALRFAALAATVLTAASLTACSAPAADDGLVHVVASTSVWGDIASTVGGDLVSVTSLIDGDTQDPHSFEASAQDQLALSRADLVIENGGGYDPFVDTLLGSAGTKSDVITAVEASGLQDGANEHIWYDFDAVDAVSAEIASRLGTIDPANAATYNANYTAFVAQLDGLQQDAAAIAADHTGEGAAVTEPVPVYLLEAAGLVNETPDAFTEAIEEGADVPPAALQQTLDLFTDGSVRVLGYNEQTASPETERVRTAAEGAGVPVVPFAETLPEGSDYVSWMTANLDALAQALA